jgi:hypothetical protein
MTQPSFTSTRERPVFRVSAGYLVAVVVIYGVTSCAWLILGLVTSHRTSERDTDLRSEVGQLWGGQHTQEAPSLVLEGEQPATPKQPAQRVVTPTPATPATTPAAAPGQPVVAAPVKPEVPQACRLQLELKPSQTRAMARLELSHRRKGLLWYSTYRVRFRARYTFKNTTPCVRRASLVIPLPARGAMYDNFMVRTGEERKEVPVQFSSAHNRAEAQLSLEPGETRGFELAYNSRGLDRWSYSFGSTTSRAKDFELLVTTNFDEVDFPDGTLSPSHKTAKDDGWELAWRFGNILADTNVSVAMPSRINPGPLAAQISLFAPVSLGFFFFVLLLVSVLRQVRLHPVHYAMLASAFFSFHLLLAYMVDHVPLWLAFTLSSLTSVGLVVSYLRLAVGARFALVWAGGAQLIYLILFSLAFFLEGYTGLTITIFSILTLFVVMQLTGRIDWSTRFGRARLDPVPPAADTISGAARQQAYGSALKSDRGDAQDTGANVAFSRVE